MMEPLRQWTCDVCGELIERPEDGYVIWKNDDQHRDYDVKIIHQSRCDLKDHSGSMPVDTYLGVNGLTWLLSCVSIGPIKKNLGQTGGPSFRDMNEFVDFARRMQIPHYEEARRKFNDRDVLDRFSDSNEVSPYLPDALREIADM